MTETILILHAVIVTPHCASTAFERWLGNIARVARGQALPDTDQVI